LSAAFGLLNRLVTWHRLPALIGMLNLLAFREELREHNLHDTSGHGEVGSGSHDGRREPRVLYTRTVDGSFNDLAQPRMGAAGARFGRNFPVQLTCPEPAPALLEPSPRTISRRLLARDSFKPAPTLNLLAAAWLQFQAHDWFSHGEPRPGDELSIPLEDSDDWFENPMRIRRTPPDPTRSSEDAGQPPTFVNELSHWWDGSALYGSDRKQEDAVRAFEGGKLRIESGRLPTDPKTGIAITGFADNWWIGLGLMHTLFALEQCDLRASRARVPVLVRPAAVRCGARGQRRSDGQDPHGRVDPGNPGAPGTPARHGRQLVGPVRGAPPSHPRAHRQG
jgi:hypothetical protein